MSNPANAKLLKYAKIVLIFHVWLTCVILNLKRTTKEITAYKLTLKRLINKAKFANKDILPFDGNNAYQYKEKENGFLLLVALKFGWVSERERNDQ